MFVTPYRRRAGVALMNSDWLGADSAQWLDLALESVLREPRQATLAREESAFDALAGPDPHVVVLAGAGALGKATLRGLRRVGIEPLAFTDNNSQLWGKEIDGLQVYSPSDAAVRFGSDSAFVVTVYNGTALRSQLATLKCSFVLPFALLFWKYAEVFIPDQGLELPHRIQEQVEDIRAGYAVLADDASRRIFCEQIRWRFLLDYGCLSAACDMRQMYFPPDVVQPIDDEVLVDCGAFDGDSIRAFLTTRESRFRRIYALEPDSGNRQALLRYIAQLPAELSSRISVLPFAASDKSERLSFSATSTGGSSIFSGESNQEIQCHPLDSLLSAEPPSYIKMDIEAAEPNAIRGAARLLAAHTPVVAACVYHRCEHLWQIPLQLRRSSDQYALFLRRYAEESWEMVCYAVPLSRCARVERLPACPQ